MPNKRAEVNIFTPLPDMTNALTVSAWVNRSAMPTAGHQRIFEHGSIDGAPYYEYAFLIHTDSTLILATATGEYQETQSNRTIPLDIWTHVAGTWDGSEIKLYINGELDSTIPRTGTINIQNDITTIGYRKAGASGIQFFAGAIDDVRVYNQALSPREITNLFNLAN